MSTNPSPQVPGGPGVSEGYAKIMICVRNLASAVHVDGSRLSRQELAYALYAVRKVHALLHRNVNALSCPMNKLPPELLAMMFSHCVAPGIDDWVWTRITLPWRQVIFNTPGFWTSLDGRRRDMMETFLRLSGSLPISLFFCPESWCICNPHVHTAQHERLVHLYRILQAHGPRLRRLDLGVCLDPSIVAQMLNFRVPRLECLTISTHMAFKPHPTSGLERMKLFDGDADALKALAILPRINWIPTNYFPNLTHFCCKLNYSLQSPAHAHDALFLLSNMPRLEHFFLERIRETTYTGTWTPPSTLIPLPQLRSIVFGSACSYESVLTVLHRLSLPKDVFIRLNDAHVREENVALLQLEMLRQPFTSIDIILYDTSDLLLVALSDTAGGFWLRATLEDIDPDPAGNWSRWLSALPAQIDLIHITTLRVRLDASHAFWPTVLAPMTKLEELDVALGNPYQGSTDPAPLPIVVLCTVLAQEPLLCPALHTLRIEWPVPSATPGADDTCAARIAEMLSARASLGARRLDMLALRMPTKPELVEKTLNGTHMLRGLVEACECLVRAEEHVFELEEEAVWWELDGDAEEYWRKEEATHPAYKLPELGLEGYR